MTRDEQKTFTEDILDGVILGETFFDRLLEIARARREAMRPWQILVKEDSSNQAGASTTFETNFALPSDFTEMYGNAEGNIGGHAEHGGYHSGHHSYSGHGRYGSLGGQSRRSPMLLVDTSNADNFIRYTQTAFQNRRIKKSIPNLFVIDMLNSRFHLLGGPLDRTYTINLYYIHDSGEISDTNEWSFPSRFHGILPFDVAAMHRGGVDYDDINARLSAEDRAEARAIWEAMIKWDDDLARKNAGF